MQLKQKFPLIFMTILSQRLEFENSCSNPFKVRRAYARSDQSRLIAALSRGRDTKSTSLIFSDGFKTFTYGLASKSSADETQIH